VIWYNGDPGCFFGMSGRILPAVIVGYPSHSVPNLMHRLQCGFASSHLTLRVLILISYNPSSMDCYTYLQVKHPVLTLAFFDRGFVVVGTGARDVTCVGWQSDTGRSLCCLISILISAIYKFRVAMPDIVRENCLLCEKPRAFDSSF
jgi:hypothetical protein